MKEQGVGFSRRGAIGVVAAVSILTAAWLLTRSIDRAGSLRLGGEAARLAAEASRRGVDAWAAQAELLAHIVERARKRRPLIAAVRARVDGTTLTDLMASEPWWTPFRGF